MTATSIASCTIAPPIGSSNPNAPNSIPTNDSPIPTSTLWTRDPARTPRDPHRLGDAVEPVDDQHDVGGLGRGRRPASAHRDADVGGRERRRVVHAVADHDRQAELGLRPRPRRPCRPGRARPGPVDADRDPDGFGDVRVVAGDHHDAFDPRPAERPDHPRRVGADRVLEQQRAARSARRSATNTHDEPSIALRRRTSRAAAGNGSPCAIHEALPSATLRSSTVPRIPEPGSSLTSFGNDSSSPR